MAFFDDGIYEYGGQDGLIGAVAVLHNWMSLTARDRVS